MALRRDLAWMAMSQALYFVFQFGASICLARLLTPAETGVYAIAFALTGVLAMIQAGGLNGFVVRETLMPQAVIRSAFTINTVMSLLLAGVIAGASTAGAIFLASDGVRQVMLVLALIPLLGIFEFRPAALIERHAGFRTIAVIGAGKALASQAVSVALACWHFSYMSIADGQVAGAAFGALAFNLAGRRHVSFSMGLAEWRRIAAFSLRMLAISGVHGLGTRLAEISLGRLVSLSALGLYQRAGNFTNMIQLNIYLVIVRVLFVDIAATARAGTSLRSSYIATLDTLTALLWPAFAGLAVLAGPLIHIIYGPRWAAAALPLALLAISSMVSLMVALSWEIFVVQQETARQTGLVFITSLVSLLLFVAGCRFGLAGAAASRIPDALFMVLMYRPHMNRMTDTRSADFYGIYARSLVLTGLAIGPSFALMKAYHWRDAIPVMQILGSVIAGICLWGAGLQLFHHRISAVFHAYFAKRWRKAVARKI